MNTPAKNPRKAVELWIKLSERPRPTCRFQLPGKDKDGNPLPECKLWILTESELHVARAQASLTAKKILGGEGAAGDLGYEEIYRNELAVQLVTLAARDPDDVTFQVFMAPEHARSALVTDEFAAFTEAYGHFRRESGPRISEMTLPEMNALISMLQEGGSSVPLSRLDSEAMSELVMHLVSLLPTSSTGNGSSTKPLDVLQPVAEVGEVTAAVPE